VLRHPHGYGCCALHEHAHLQCVLEATLLSPRETGGTFMGYWSACGNEVVITRLIAAGPRALHARTAFEPDQQWQLREIARHYSASGRREGYLGDWHSHPGATSGKLSGIDRSVLHRIIRTREARTPRPISVVYWGVPGHWQASAWVAALSGAAPWPARVSVVSAQMQLYETTGPEAHRGRC
jgi:integrative and conjugative element protein (TIGR02256 family)